jgi:hypothetical protein
MDRLLNLLPRSFAYSRRNITPSKSVVACNPGLLMVG